MSPYWPELFQAGIVVALTDRRLRE